VTECYFMQGDCLRLPFKDRSFNLVVTSPPYEDCRLYGRLDFKLRGQGWVEWMLPRVVEACRVSSGLALFVMSAKVRKHAYSCAVEWLVADLTRHQGVVVGPAPYCFYRDGIFGSGGRRYHKRNWEPVYGFCFPDRLPLAWSDNLATGHPPKYPPGGNPSHRKQDGSRVTSKPYRPPKLANAGNVLSGSVGGGHMGNPLACENEAPFPEWLVEWFIKSYAPPGGWVLDPMSGSGTTAVVAARLGRNGVGVDVRPDQCRLGECRAHGMTVDDYRLGLRPMFGQKFNAG
jgi:hypothetical protein